MSKKPTPPMMDDALYPELCCTCAEGASDFGKMFPDLPYFAEGLLEADVIAALRRLGAPGGLMDARDPVVTTVNPLDASASNRDNPNEQMTVGFTFLGQFIDHDLTFDPLPLVTSVTDGKNLRTPKLDLDSVYGRGPEESPLLYRRPADGGHGSPSRFLIDDEAARDLPRTSEGVAIIGDPRNDENVIISQLHLAFMKLHNRVVDDLEAEAERRRARNEDPGAGLDGAPPEPLHKRIFRTAQRLVRWHYQYVVLNQFLTATLDPTVYREVRCHGPTLLSSDPCVRIPREFQVAAYRFGHSQVRPGYKVNVAFGAPIFDIGVAADDGDPNDLRGGRRAPRRTVEWDTFFDFGTEAVEIESGRVVVGKKVKQNKRIDPILSSALFALPLGPGLPGPEDHVRTLASRNLERHVQHRLPSGQDVATRLGYASLTFSELSELGLGLETRTPLWYYVLAEARAQHDGKRLGQVGSRIVAEVFLHLLLSDPESYLSRDPSWTPTLPTRSGVVGTFTMTDLLTHARVA